MDAVRWVLARFDRQFTFENFVLHRFTVLRYGMLLLQPIHNFTSEKLKELQECGSGLVFRSF